MNSLQKFIYYVSGLEDGLIRGIVCAQALLMRITYRSPADPLGAREGLESPGDVVQAGTQDVLVPSMSQVCDDSDNLARKYGSKRIRVVFIGDSLVTGVGCAEGPNGGGPLLPRYVCRLLSRYWNVEVSWKVFGLSGAGIQVLGEELLPKVIEEEVSEVQFAVVIVGVNDWKGLRRPSHFHADLEIFLQKLQSHFGTDCKLVLPCLPLVKYAPGLVNPLRTVVEVLSHHFDLKKLDLSRTMRNVLFVSRPSSEAEQRLANTIGISNIFCPEDGLHPSSRGYAWWAEHIAAEMLMSSKLSPEKEK